MVLRRMNAFESQFAGFDISPATSAFRTMK